MNSRWHKLERRYAATLKKYLADEQEAVLEQAYELGRHAIAMGLGVLDVARVHQQALAELLRFDRGREARSRALKAAGTFFLESLMPFEVTHRGFRETNLRLQELIATLERRNLELKVEIRERKRTEKALRETEEHTRELFNEARRMEENLRNLSNQMVHAQEEERKRISRELHDEVGQALTAISVTLATMKNGSVTEPRVRLQGFADAQQLLQSTMETVHRFARELRPAMLDELGLVPALRSYLKGFAERTGLQVHFCGDGVVETLNAEQKIVLYRVAQESLTNVARHAVASRVQVSVRKIGADVCLEVEDNGRSFRQDAKHSSNGRNRLGLLGMHERVRLVSGQLTVKAEPGHGTTILVVIPFRAANSSIRGRRPPDDGGRQPSPLSTRPETPVRQPQTPLRSYGKRKN